MEDLKTTPKWVERELMNYARNGSNTRSDDFEIQVKTAYEIGLKIVENNGSMDDAFIEMDLYLSTID